MRTLFALLLLASPAVAEPGVCPDGRIHINEADAGVFSRLKGVGDKKAAAIVADRATNGPFANTAALNRVKGIGDKSLEAWAAQITVSCDPPPLAPAGLVPAEAGKPLAAKTKDDDKVVADTALISLNTATAEQLGGLPGIGPKTAEAIVQLRTQKGGSFKSLDELSEVKGIGEAKLAKLKPLLTLGDTGTHE